MKRIDNFVDKRGYNWISNLRVLSMLMILLCHLIAEAPFALFRFTSQFFKVGVPIFFMISGFLFGIKEIKESISEWYVRRLRRILAPYYLFLMILASIYIILEIPFQIKNWLVSIICLQGMQIYIWGAEHLWFLTVLFVCYFITPILNEIRRRNNVKIWIVFVSINVILSVIVTYIVDSQLGIYWNYLIVYTLAYISGHLYKRWSGKEKIWQIIPLFVVGTIGRLCGKYFWDNTLMYNSLIVGFTEACLAGSFFLFAKKYLCRRVIKLVSFLDKISFEVYLCHYMFIVGPISLMSITQLFLVNCVFVCISSIILAWIMNRIVNMIMKKSLRKLNFSGD